MTTRNRKFMILITFLLSSSTPASPANVLVPPKPVTVLNGDTILFTCTASGDTIDFIVDGVLASDSSVAELGFTQSLIRVIDDSSIQRNLTAVANVEINDTEVTCRALTFGDFSVDITSPVSLLIQGPLPSINGFAYSSLEGSDSVNITWSLPYTLLGVDIIGYNVTFTISNNTITSIENLFILTNHYIIQKARCDEITLTATGYNGLNGTNGSTLMIPVESGNIVFAVEVNSSTIVQELIISTNINVTNVCPTHFPTNITITVECDNEVIQVISDDVSIPMELIFVSIQKTILGSPADYERCGNYTQQYNLSATVQLLFHDDRNESSISKVVYFTLLKEMITTSSSCCSSNFQFAYITTSGTERKSYASQMISNSTGDVSSLIVPLSQLISNSNIVTESSEDSSHVHLGIIIGSVIFSIIIVIVMIGISCFIYWRKVTAQLKVDKTLRVVYNYQQDVCEANPSYGQLPLQHTPQTGPIVMDENHSYAQVNFIVTRNKSVEPTHHIYENSSTI